jgi:hypothetical protein
LNPFAASVMFVPAGKRFASRASSFAFFTGCVVGVVVVTVVGVVAIVVVAVVVVEGAFLPCAFGVDVSVWTFGAFGALGAFAVSGAFGAFITFGAFGVSAAFG